MDLPPSTSSFASGSIITGDLRKRTNQNGSSESSKRARTESTKAEPMSEHDDDYDDYDELVYGNEVTEEINTVYLELLKPDVSLEKFGIPVTIDKFISSIISVDATLHSKKSFSDMLNIHSKLRSVTGKLTFESLDIYNLYYLPVVMYCFGKLMAKKFAEKSDTLKDDPSSYYEDVYVLMKEEFHSELDFRLVKFRRKTQFESPEVGDLIFLRAKSIKNQREDPTYDENYHFGIFLSSHSRVVKPQVYAIESLILNQIPEEQRSDMICEESTVRVRLANSLLLRTDFQLGIYKLANCLFHMLQAKALYSLGANSYQEHFLNPVMVIKNSGLTMEENLNLEPAALDTIQKAIDLVGQNDPSSSCFLSIDFQNLDGYNELLKPILKQINLNVSYLRTQENELTSILVLSKSRALLNQLYDYLTGDEYFGEDEVIIDPSSMEADKVDAKLITLFQSHIATLKQDREQIQKGVERYSKCIEYLQKNRSLDDLLSQWIVDMQRTRREVKRRLIRNSKVILTDLETIFKDDQYTINFNSKTAGKQRILCCVLIDAHLYSEPETVSLTNFGISKFILMGNSSTELPYEEQLTPKGLNRSLFHRLHSIDSKELEKSPYSSFVKI